MNDFNYCDIRKRKLFIVIALVKNLHGAFLIILTVKVGNVKPWFAVIENVQCVFLSFYAIDVEYIRYYLYMQVSFVIVGFIGYGEVGVASKIESCK